MSKNKYSSQGSSQGSFQSQGSQFSTKVTEQAGCGKVISETFTPNDPTVSCTRCGAESHDPSLLCSPSTTLASSTQTRESSSSYSGGYSKDSGSSGGGSGSSGMGSGFGSGSGGKHGGHKNR